jgi:hypothetical protein
MPLIHSLVTVLLDSGAAGQSWAVWDGCTEDLCAPHTQYQPSNGPEFFNFSVVDTISFGAGTTFFESWRVNDTLTFGTSSTGAGTTSVTFGASFSLDGSEELDFPLYSNHVSDIVTLGIAKGYFVAAECVTYPNFIEDAYSNAAISNPVIPFYQVH